MRNKRQLITGLMFFLLLLLVGIYAFTQALQVPLSSVTAEKVWEAWNILQGAQSSKEWHFSPFELPVYLLCVKLIGLGTFSAVAASVFFFLTLFGCGLLVLRSQKLTDLSCMLVWIAVCGLPDPLWLSALRTGPFFIALGMILLPNFLALFLEKRRVQFAAAAVACGIGAVLSIPPGFSFEQRGRPVHETMRAIQKIFRADFSLQPLLKFSTCRYFLMTLVILLTGYCMIRTLYDLIRRQSFRPFECLYAVFLTLTILFCCLPVSGTPEQRMLICSWLPFGSALLLAGICSRLVLSGLRFAQKRFSFSLLVMLISGALIVFGFSPIVLSRPASPADRVVIYLDENGKTYGCCDPSDLPLLTVASKGRIQFTADCSSPDNSFQVLRTSETVVDEGQNAAGFGPYTVLLMP